MAAGRYMVVFLLWFISCNGVYSSAVDEGPDWYDKPLELHPCNRPCVEGETMTCRYTFSLETYYAMSKACYDCPDTLKDCYREDCISADGVKRTVMVVNRQLPGPAIEVCLGDKVIVDLDNRMNDRASTIHWHGHHQVKSPYMDGVPFITQCPVSPNSVFRYTMYATNRGTHFWHAHAGLQRADGVFGALVVRTTESENPHLQGEPLYDKDLPKHTIIINDWTHRTTMDKYQDYFQSSGSNKPDTILVNGMGRFYKDSVPVTSTPLAVFTVTKGVRYRFRLITSGVYLCPIELYIDKHDLTAIASDGYFFEPVVVDSLVSYAGERWDFVLNANQEVGNYWIRFTGLMHCDQRFNSAHQVAVLHYEGAPEVEPSEPVGYNVHPTPKLQLNPLNARYNEPGTLSLPKLLALNKTEDKELLEPIADHYIYLAFDYNPVDNPEYHKAGVYGYYMVNQTYRRHSTQFNHITFKMPHVPLLTQYDQVDPDLYCYNQDLTNCDKLFCSCIYIFNIPLGSKVELILIDEGVPTNASHAFHLHGYAFRVVGTDRLGETTTMEAVNQLDKAGKLVRNLIDPPIKDTVTVPDGGYTILRFHANNPGYWAFHCHIESHHEEGMMVVFKIGEPEDFPPVPKGFPPCGDYLGYWAFHCHIESHLEEGMMVVFKIGEPEDFPPVPKGFPPCGDYLG